MAARMHQKWFCDRALSIVRKRNYLSNCGVMLYKHYQISKASETGLRKSCSLCTSATNASTGINHETPRVIVAVCLQRLPTITRENTELEKRYLDLQEQLEYEHSSVSDYEVYEINFKNLQEQLKNDVDNEALKKEVALLDSKYQELKEIEQQHIKDAVMGSRITEADKTGNNHTPNRKLEMPLFLLTQQKVDKTKWLFPQGQVNSGETLQQAAERIIKDHVLDGLSVQFMSNAPSGVYRKSDRDGIPTNTPKVFFYQANLQGSIHKYPDDLWANSVWASKYELEKYLPKNYFQSVLKFLL